MRRPASAILPALLLALVAAPALAKGPRRVEVVAVHGLVDASVERSVMTTLRDAEASRAEIVVVQIDTRGALGADRTARLAEAIRTSAVPTVTWIGPPGARAEQSGAVLALAGQVRAMAPGAALGPVDTLDLRANVPPPAGVPREALSADAAESSGAVDVVALQLPDLLRKLDGRTVGERTLRTVGADLAVRVRKGDLIGRALHAVTQPSVAYLLLLVGLVGIVFEIFHPDTGPAGIGGLLAVALAMYAFVVMRGSWAGLALLAAGVAVMCVDLRMQSLGILTLGGEAGLVSGSILLFHAQRLRASPWVIAAGVAGMTAFLLGAMTRVLRDLRAVRSGDRTVVDPVEELQRHADT